MKPTAAKLNSLSFYGEWEDSKRQTAKIAKYTYVSACQIVEAQYAVAYPDDPDRKDYVYLFNPATQSYWARCDALRPAEKQAEWSFRIEGKWSEEKRTDVRIPGTGRAVIEPPPPPI